MGKSGTNLCARRGDNSGIVSLGFRSRRYGLQVKLVHGQDEGPGALDTLNRFPGLNGVHVDTRANGGPIGREVFTVAAEAGDSHRPQASFHFYTERADGVAGHRNGFDTWYDFSFGLEFGETDFFNEVLVVAMIQGVGISAEGDFIAMGVELSPAKQ